MNINYLIKNNKVFYTLISLLFLFILYFSPQNGTFEPDSYFHFAISKLSAEQGLIRSIPQLEDIGWSVYFPEKEFLFHQLTKIGYILGGDAGVLLFCNILSTLILTLIVFIGESLSSRKVALTITAIMILNGNFFFRLILIRPHLAGILIALVILLGLIKANRWILMVGCLLFPLFYHAFYIPLLFIGVFSLVTKFKNIKFILLYGVLPILCGIIINPYFPSNLVMTWLGIKIAFSSSHSVNVGMEARPLGFIKSVDMIGYLIVISLSILSQVRKFRTEYPNILPLLLICIILQVLFFISPRTIEYLIPLTTILFISVVPFFADHYKSSYVFIVIILLTSNIRYLGYHFQGHDDVNKRTSDLLGLIKNLPDNTHEKVFNCEWETGSLVLYERPNLKVVEILDPNFIYMHDSNLAKVKELMMVYPKDIHTVLTKLFKADYVLCVNPTFIKAMADNEDFVKIAESKREPKAVIYKIRKETK